ncbi:MAG: hypothetical protein JWM19_5871 [Actinomycetia bacterium]|nr:hypothetical protein [Actinomycetes bacterium]
MLGHHWEKAVATVVGRFVREQAVGRTPRYDFLVDVRPYGGSPQRMTIQDGPADCDHPSDGDVLGVLYDRKNQRVKWDTSDTWPLDSAAARRAGGDGLASAAAAPPGTPPGAPWSEMAGFAGGVQSFSGEAASQMLDSLLGPGGAETIAAMKARARDQGAPAGDPAERLARLQALRDSGVLTEAEYEAQRQKIISAI